MRILDPEGRDVTEETVDNVVNEEEDVAGGSISKSPLSGFSGTIDASNVGDLVHNDGEQSPEEKAFVASMLEADEEDRKEYERKAEEARKEADVDVDVGSHTESDPLLSSAAGTDIEGTVKISREQKDAFCTALVENSRYIEKFELFGGKITLTIRSRTLEETDSIEAYLRWMTTTGAVNTVADYSNLTRKVLLTAQVQELNGVRFPELKGPMYMEDTEDGRKMPGWVSQLSAWERQSSALAVAAVRCLTEFEARYWFMVDNSKDTNFWNRGESTAE